MDAKCNGVGGSVGRIRLKIGRQFRNFSCPIQVKLNRDVNVGPDSKDTYWLNIWALMSLLMWYIMEGEESRMAHISDLGGW